MTLFEDHPQQDVQRAVALVEQTLVALGSEPAGCRQPGAAGEQRFALWRGSAQLTIAVRPATDGRADGTIRVWASVVRLPSEDRRPGFFQRLLELNGAELSGAAFAIVGDDAVLIAERSVRDLDASEVDALVRAVGDEADRFDDQLAAEFDTVRSSDTGPS